MSYSSSNVRAILPTGFSGGGAIFLHRSSDAATDIEATGFFAGAGYGGRARSTAASKIIGMRYGDVVVHVESSGGATPGRVTWHSVIGSTADNASTAGSTGWLSCYNVTVSAHAAT